MTSKDYKNSSLGALLDLYRQSDADAFTEFFGRTSKLVFNFLTLKLRNKVEAEDVMQETYFRIHRYVSSYDSERNALAWTISIARNALIDHVRMKKGARAHVDVSELQVAGDDPGPERLAEFRQLIANLCRDLSSEEQELLAERILAGATYEEIAGSKGMTVENARQKVSRLLKRLKSGSAS